jgi:hypothetical protein
MRRLPTIFSRVILFILCPFVLTNVTACQSSSLDTTHNGRSTWRAEELQLVPGGGRIHVNVLCDSEDPITVVLLSEGVFEQSETPSGPTCAAASGVTRSGMLLVRFRDLPVSEYMVVAFHDLNGDGRLVGNFEPSGFATEFTEPHSKLERFHLHEGDTVNVSLDLDIIHSDGDQES